MTTVFQSAWWTTSRTMYFNLLIAVLAIVEQFSGFAQPYIPINVFAALTTILFVGNIVLRILTQAKLVSQLTKEQQ